MTGIIDVGGGLRGIFGAGVFDGLLDLDIHFENAIGISAGSANVITYLARQKERNYRFFCDYVFRKEYMSIQNMLKKGSYIDFDYIYGTLSHSDGEDPLDYDMLEKFEGDFRILATDALTGKPKFFTLKDDVSRDDYSVLGASCCIPVVNKPVFINDRPYFDGGVVIPVPIDYALDELKWDKAVVILTLPKDFEKVGGIDAKGGKMLDKKYSVVGDLLVTRAQRYNRQVKKCLKLEQEGRVLVIAPDDTCGIDTLSKTPEGLAALYQKGVDSAPAIKAFLEK